MNFKAIHFCLIAVVWSCCCGCVTKRLWEDKAFNEASPQPNLQLYYSETKRDVLVVYDEVREPSSSVCRRGYYLNHYQAPTQKPAFVDLRATNQLTSIPILVKTNAATPPPGAKSFAVLDDTAKFSVTVNGIQRGPYELPVYPSGFHQGAQIALTPATVVADAVIAGTVVGLIVWECHGFDNVH